MLLRTKNKKGVSVIIGYVLIVAFAIIMSIIIYPNIKTYVPSDSLECPDGVSMFIEKASCIDNTDGTFKLNLNLKNNGRFNIHGYYIYATTEEGKELAAVNLRESLTVGDVESNLEIEKSLTNMILFKSEKGIIPNAKITNDFTLNKEIYLIEIIPMRFQDTEFVTCSGAKIKEKIVCGEAVAPVEIPADCGTDASTSRTSCKNILDTCSGSSDGTYWINPLGSGAFEVYCDMTTDGGGYTFYKVNQGTAYSASQAESYCATLGMHLFVPRTKAHKNSAFAYATSGADPSSNYMYILAIYPRVKGNKCIRIAFTDETCIGWRAWDDNGFWVSDRTDITEPNGDNCLGCSMYYEWNPDGGVKWYNDYDKTFAINGYTSSRFMCDVGDKF